MPCAPLRTRKIADYAYYTTIGGNPIRYPNAYRWPKIYHRSSKKIVVGKEWIRRHRGLQQYGDGIIQGWFLPSLKEKHLGIKIIRVLVWDKCITIVKGNKNPDYHIYGKPEIKSAIKTAITAWKKFKNAKIEKANLLEKSKHTWIGTEHVQKTGACLPGIQKWCERHNISLEAWHRADKLLEIDPNNSYLHKAILFGYSMA